MREQHNKLPFKYQTELDFAKNLMTVCAVITKNVQDKHIDAQQKADRSPVTIADYAVQAFVAKAIQDKFPGDILVGEESGSTLLKDQNLLNGVVDQLKPFYSNANSETISQWIDRGKGVSGKRFWVLDPVDGTKGFLRKMQYVTALALVVDGEVEIGVIGCPNLNPDFAKEIPSIDINLQAENNGGVAYAGKGTGAWWQDFKKDSEIITLKVSEEKRINQIRIVRSFEDGHTNRGQIENFISIAGIEVEPVRMDSQAKYVLLAGGFAELLLRLPPDENPNYHENIWDQAPAYRVILESGGKMTDLLGQPLDFTTGDKLLNNRGIMASNGLIHEQSTDILSQLI